MCEMVSLRWRGLPILQSITQAQVHCIPAQRFSYTATIYHSHAYFNFMIYGTANFHLFTHAENPVTEPFTIFKASEPKRNKSFCKENIWISLVTFSSDNVKCVRDFQVVMHF